MTDGVMMSASCSLPPETPVFYAPSIEYYVLTRYADVEAVFLDPTTYSAAQAQLPLVPLVPEAAEILRGGGHKPQPSMVSLDPPAHTRATVFPRPEAFDPRRANASKNLAFGKGIHYCVGASLGQLEARLALEILTRRFPRLRLVEGQRFTFHPNISFRGPQELWVRSC